MDVKAKPPQPPKKTSIINQHTKQDKDSFWYKLRLKKNRVYNKFLYYYEPLIPKFYKTLAYTILVIKELVFKLIYATFLCSSLMLIGVQFTLYNYLSCLSIVVFLPIVIYSFYKMLKGD